MPNSEQRITPEEIGQLCHEAQLAADNLEVAQFEADIARAEYRLALRRYRKQSPVV